MPVTLDGASTRGRRQLAAVVRAALAGEGLRPGDIAIRLTGDAELRELNRRWRGIDRATDVLSFSYDGDGRPAGPAVNGDLVISLDRMRAQARRYRVSPGRELARLVIHGALHLAGHDHHRDAERRAMRARETAALRASRAAIAALDRALAAPAVTRVRKARYSGPTPTRRRARRA